MHLELPPKPELWLPSRPAILRPRRVNKAFVPGMVLPPITGAGGAQTAIATLTSLGLTTNLKQSLDAGDGNSYTSGQVWSDVSGNANDITRGATSGAEASDPTFNGVADGKSLAEYWSFDGADYFRDFQTFDDGFHQTNGAFTFVAWIYLPSFGTAQAIAANGSTNGTGYFYYAATSAALTLRIYKQAVQQITGNSSNTISANVWTYAGVALDGVAGTMDINLNGTLTQLTGKTWTSAVVSGAETIAGDNPGGVPAFPFLSGARMGQFHAWDAALTSTNLAAIFTATRGRYGV